MTKTQGRARPPDSSRAPAGPRSISAVTKPRPRGREDVANAILDSARTLIADRGPSSVALREIADDAGVNFGLLYHYFGTKDQLLNEVYARSAGNAADRFLEVDHLDDALGVLMTMGDGATARLVAWAVLEGRDPAELFGESPALSVLADLVQRDAGEEGNPVSADAARVFAAIAMVIALGWRLFGPLALTMAGAEAHEPSQYADQVQGYVRRFAKAAVMQLSRRHLHRGRARRRSAPRPNANGPVEGSSPGQVARSRHDVNCSAPLLTTTTSGRGSTCRPAAAPRELQAGFVEGAVAVKPATGELAAAGADWQISGERNALPALDEMAGLVVRAQAQCLQPSDRQDREPVVPTRPRRRRPAASRFETTACRRWPRNRTPIPSPGS